MPEALEMQRKTVGIGLRQFLYRLRVLDGLNDRDKPARMFDLCEVERGDTLKINLEPDETTAAHVVEWLFPLAQFVSMAIDTGYSVDINSADFDRMRLIATRSRNAIGAVLRERVPLLFVGAPPEEQSKLIDGFIGSMRRDVFFKNCM